MRYMRLGAVISAALVTAGCGSADKPDPKPSSPSSNVYMDVVAADDFLPGKPGIVILDTSNYGPARTVRITLRLDAEFATKVTLERPVDDTTDQWKKLPLTAPGSSASPAAKKTVSASYTAHLGHGSELLNFRLTSREAPRTGGEEIGVHATITAGGRTLADDDGTVPLAALTTSTTAAGKDDAVVRRKGGWTQVTVTITNHTRATFPAVDVQADYRQCQEEGNEGCDSTSQPYVTDDFTTQWASPNGWKTMLDGSGGTGPKKYLTVPLPAGTSRTLRLRIEAASSLAEDTSLVKFRVWSTGLANGAKQRSLGSAGNGITLTVR